MLFKGTVGEKLRCKGKHKRIWGFFGWLGFFFSVEVSWMTLPSYLRQLIMGWNAEELLLVQRRLHVSYWLTPGLLSKKLKQITGCP